MTISTVTTERLKQIASGNAFTCTQDDESASMAAELLAVREAQSVPAPYNQVQRDMMKDIVVRKLDGNLLGETLDMDDIHAVTMELMSAGFRLHAAPPAPAVPDFGALTKLIVGRLIDCGTANDDSIADAEVFVYNACRAAMLKNTLESAVGTAPAVNIGNMQNTPAGFKLVPVDLTAENGAKASLIGEFTEVKYINCPECFGDDWCEGCDGSGRIKVEVPVTWTTIKAIWKKGIEHFDSLAAAPTPTRD